MKTPLVIFGAGDIARLAQYYFDRDSSYRVVGFAVDAAYRPGETFQNLPLVAFERVMEVFPPSEHMMFVALSYARMNRLRAEKVEAASALGYDLASYVSSRCTYLAPEPPGSNSFILEDNTIQPFVRLGRNVTLWSGNHIGHDAVIEDHCFVSSHVVVSGHCRIGAYSFLGVNATVRDSVVIAPETLVGAGAAVLEDTKTRDVVLPARGRLSSRRSDEIEL